MGSSSRGPPAGALALSGVWPAEVIVIAAGIAVRLARISKSEIVVVGFCGLCSARISVVCVLLLFVVRCAARRASVGTANDATVPWHMRTKANGSGLVPAGLTGIRFFLQNSGSD